MKFINAFIWAIFFNTVEAFLFTINKNNALGSCEPNFLCPPMCLKTTPTGCECDCSKIDPSHPEHLGGNSNQQSSQTGYNIQNGGGCNTNWMSCQAPCAAAINPTSGCVECNCPQAMTLQPASTKSTTSTGTTSHVVTTKQPLTPSPVITQQKTTQMPTTPTPQTSTTRTTQSQTTQASSSSSSSTLSSTKSLTTSSNPSCQGAIQCILSCPNGFFIDPIPAPDGCPRCFCKTAQLSTSTSSGNPSTTQFQTVSFPVHLTTPHSSATPTTTTRPPSTTLHRIVCPGVFNCSKTCYTGYRLDSQGCPLCECAPLPTGLP
ncbi:uncharacterized protein LOC128173244 [Crassostrea angulata]|uniref:uncharacterized protein LOC128173244 n=1 Tax=Magallana angulata TaxID=2784310 RepID=UPI0022B0D5D3|nr:uncharacterized protein LOC128173244 [Crassostrea angulata]